MPVNILVADDSVTMRRILELTFQGEDARVTLVDSGEAAVRRAGELTPDVVFADLSLSGMDGYAIATAIKNTPGLERTAVIVMASQKLPYDEERGRAAGVDDHILKPFDTQHVIDRVKQILGKPRVAPSAGAGAGAAGGSAAMDAGRQSRVGSKTIAFGKPPAAAPAPPAAAPQQRSQPQPIAAPKPAIAAPAFGAASVATAQGSELERKLNGMGLTPDQVQGVLSISRDVIEKIVWEIVPDLAETIIKEEIRRLTAE